MSETAFSLCVYCGSRTGTDPLYSATAAEVGRWIGEHRGQLVYGGGRNGLMGVTADAVLQSGGRVIGVIPEALVDREMAHPGCTELHVVQTMHERKHKMAEISDAFLALPGGIGTLEELFEVWTWRQLGYHQKPIGILNVRRHYDALYTFLERVESNGFMSAQQSSLVIRGEIAPPLLSKLIQAAGFSPPPDLTAI
ncbi:MAG: TIGR00730 family Rossman fold protein [Rhodoferax sp.]|nr:TIGR00730 family Rossman fold protein [Rhodoferax sp.]